MNARLNISDPFGTFATLEHVATVDRPYRPIATKRIGECLTNDERRDESARLAADRPARIARELDDLMRRCREEDHAPTYDDLLRLTRA